MRRPGVGLGQRCIGQLEMNERGKEIGVGRGIERKERSCQY